MAHLCLCLLSKLGTLVLCLLGTLLHNSDSIQFCLDREQIFIFCWS
jgi:hypothetical protein